MTTAFISLPDADLVSNRMRAAVSEEVKLRPHAQSVTAEMTARQTVRKTGRKTHLSTGKLDLRDRSLSSMFSFAPVSRFAMAVLFSANALPAR